MAKSPTSSLAPKAVGVRSIPTDSIIPNPHNPRMLFDREPLGILRESIGSVGILVPLTVFWSESRSSFVILDGQRRWICAKELNLLKIPVNQVAEPTLVQNIVTMFQIHELREDWELMPTALKLDVLMHELKERSEIKLSELTGLTRAVVSRCKKLLSYPKKYQDLMLDPLPENRVKADFFIELYTVINDRFVNKMEWFKRNSFTQRMLEKYLTKSGIKAVTDFRIIKQYINNTRRAGQEEEITRRLKEFVDDDTLSLDYLNIKSVDVSANARKLISSISKIEEDIRSIDVQELYGEEQLWLDLEKLMTIIEAKLRSAGRRIQE